MEQILPKELTLGRMLGFLTRQYIGFLAKRMTHTPVERYYYPLYLIGKNSGTISQQQLANHLLTDKVSMVRILDVLAEEGYIERRVNPEDRRQHLLHVTKKGEPWIGEIEQALNETDDFFLSMLPKEQRALFRQQLLTLVNVSKELPVEEVELFYNRVKK